MQQPPDIAPQKRETMILLAVGVIAALVYLSLYPRIMPAAHVNFEVNRAEAIDIARNYLTKIDFQMTGFKARAHTVKHEDLAGYLFDLKLDPVEREEITARHPELHWRVLFAKPDSAERFFVKVGPTGEVLGFENQIPADTQRRQVPFSQAAAAAKHFLTQGHNIDWKVYQRAELSQETQEARSDYTFKWKRRESSAFGMQERIWVQVLGDRIGGWGHEVVFPASFQETYNTRANRYQIFSMGQGFVFLLIIALSLVFFVIQMRNNELSFRVAFKWAAICIPVITVATLNEMLGSAVFLEETLSTGVGPRGLLPMIAGLLYILIGISFLLPVVWSGGEAMTRDPWPEKLEVIDALFTGKVFFPEYGRAVMRGFCLGFCWSALYLVLITLFAREGQIWLTPNFNLSAALTTVSPVAFPLLKAGFLTTLYTPLFFAFPPPFIRRYVKRDRAAVLLVVFLFHPLVIFHETLSIYNVNLQILINLVVALLLHLFYLRYDVFTVLVGIFVSQALDGAMIFLVQPNADFRLAGAVNMALLGGLFVHALLASRRGKSLNLSELAPSYTQFLSERKRLQSEMDFARQVQMKMLPQTIPTTPRLEIVVLSEPAKDVGGDYYDFIELSGGRLGVVVGDVTGKGLSSCMYMTLTKGMFLAHAYSYPDPEEMLGQVNRSYYLAADRRIFVSLLYCVIDPQTGLVEYARAGHEPMILRKASTGKTQLLRPIGMAVGLAPTEIFEKSLRRARVALENGDMLIMYTDGLTEGVNKDGEAFGLDRLLGIIESVGESAWHLLERIDKEHKAFVGRTEQHDDITCLVIQIRDDLVDL